MESTATLRHCGLSALKMRQVAALVRGKDVDVALHSLKFVTKAAARPLEKLITSAVANAREKANAADERFDADAFFVKTVLVDGGPSMKRFRPRAQGRAYPIRKRSCHVHVVLQERAGKAGTAPRRKRPAAAAPVAPPAEKKGKSALSVLKRAGRGAAKSAKASGDKPAKTKKTKAQAAAKAS
jgi:large subunit ribosomal protein L22